MGPSNVEAVAQIAAVIQAGIRSGPAPYLIGIDGGSGSGKTTIAAEVAAQIGVPSAATIIPSDDFYAAHIPDRQWDQWTPAERYLSVIDWWRLRSQALEPLLNGRSARWHPFDFNAQRPDGTYPLSDAWAERDPAACVILEGAYSCRPELADLLRLKVLVEVPIPIRHARLAKREAAAFLAGWHVRWDAVEAYYFSQIRPPAAFDVVVRPH